MRVRFAPSPTGALHIGSIRTALFNWLSARSTGGTFILRIEDTDQQRYVPGSESQIVESLQWLGLTWDEGPGIGGPHSPYIQSERTALYRDIADQLVARSAAYWCVCTTERLSEMRAAQRAASQPTRYDRHCLSRQAEIAQLRADGTPAVLRQLMPGGSSRWDDVVRGDITFNNADVDDSVLLKSDGYPTYHLANVVDDHLMEITHVIRAEEWIPSTPKHLALYAAMEWQPPRFAHVPVVLGTDRLKLSKRRGAKSILDYRELGYLPAAIINMMALLGWSSGSEQEIFSPAELQQHFSIERVHPAPAIFDPQRLDAINAAHIRAFSDEQLADTLQPWCTMLDRALLLRVAPLLRERIVKLSDATALVQPLVGGAQWDESVAFPPKKVSPDAARALIDRTVSEISNGALGNIDGLRATLSSCLEDHDVKARDGFRVLFIAILGSPVGLPIFDVMSIIGKDEVIRRLRDARDRIAPSVPAD